MFGGERYVKEIEKGEKIKCIDI